MYQTPKELSADDLEGMRLESGELNYDYGVPPREWADYNGHLNGAFYGVIFNQVADSFFIGMGLTGPRNVEETNLTCFTLETRYCFYAEVAASEALSIRFRILSFDQKRVHYYLQMKKPNGKLAATTEQILICVDLKTRRATQFSQNALTFLSKVKDWTRALNAPRDIGKSLGLDTRK